MSRLPQRGQARAVRRPARQGVSCGARQLAPLRMRCVPFGLARSEAECCIVANGLPGVLHTRRRQNPGSRKAARHRAQDHPRCAECLSLAALWIPSRSPRSCVDRAAPSAVAGGGRHLVPPSAAGAGGRPPARRRMRQWPVPRDRARNGMAGRGPRLRPGRGRPGTRAGFRCAGGGGSRRSMV
jgi:hypothetical protein